MIFKLLSIIVLVQTARSNPQFLTFENGKFGVNFGGYHAEAGLGGLLTGNAAHGGLGASAGTPFGQIAGAGLGGSLDGKTAGGLYAGASAGHGVGASAAIGGGLDAAGVGTGGIQAESHAGGVSKKVVKVTETQPEVVKTVTYVDETPPRYDATYSNDFSASNTFDAHSSVESGFKGQTAIGSTYNAQSPLGSVAGSVDSQSSIHTNVDAAPQVYVQKYKKTSHHHHHLWPSHNKVEVETRFDSGVNANKEVHVAATPVATQGAYAGSSSQTNYGFSGGYDHQASSKFFNDIFNIPIATLQAVNRLVSNKVARGGANIDIHKTVTVN